MISVTPVISAAAIYTAGDALGGRLEFPAVVTVASGQAVVTKVVIVDDDLEDAPIDLVFFDQPFTATADNAPFDPSDADLQNCLGYVSVAATDYASFVDNSVACVTPKFDIDSHTWILYAQMVVRGTPTYTAVDDLTIKIAVERI